MKAKAHGREWLLYYHNIRKASVMMFNAKYLILDCLFEGTQLSSGFGFGMKIVPL